ncbi:MAG: HD family phosphohydrolase [Verrucomicrobiae bacterium]|nr:HD family phosphohydrolase [Verrucomicrobiae bacterium]
MKHSIDHKLAESLDKAPDADAKVELLFDYMLAKGNSRYDEAVTQLEHGLQAACLARHAHAPPSEITAALLHDIGHLLVDEFEGTDDFLYDDLGHELIGADYLEPYFPSEVIEPIRLHVPAKRYLCTVDADYFDRLSTASQRSFELQGGKLSEEDKAAMDACPHLQAALRLRRWDDLAKTADLEVPEINSYRGAVRQSLS